MIRWRRHGTGAYALEDTRRREVIAIVERSAILPWIWWWRAFGVPHLPHIAERPRFGTSTRCGLAKRAAEEALR